MSWINPDNGVSPVRQVIIISIRGNGTYDVELANGQNGVLYFWMGD